MTAYPQPPPPLNEDVPLPPASRVTQTWRPGFYDWTGATYEWHPGEWVPLEGHGRLWQDGYWRQDGRGGLEWVRPGWK